MLVRVLGCGPSPGIPSIEMGWGGCNPNNPKNRRLRSSLYIETDQANILFDTSPDIREQLLSFQWNRIDALIYTHAHADHVHGIDEVRSINRINKQSLPVYCDQNTYDEIRRMFSYAFDEMKIAYYYKPHLLPNIIKPFEFFRINNLAILPIPQDHGFGGTSYGFRIGDFAYSTDVKTLSNDALNALKGVKVWIVDCLRYKEHGTHTHLAQTLEWIEYVKPNQAYFTHMSDEFDYDRLCKDLPPHIRPAYDGLMLEI